MGFCIGKKGDERLTSESKIETKKSVRDQLVPWTGFVSLTSIVTSWPILSGVSMVEVDTAVDVNGSASFNLSTSIPSSSPSNSAFVLL